MLFFLIFPETVRAEEEDQVGPQAQEDFYNSSTDSCLTFPYSSNSPRPFPPSPVHSVTDSPKRVSPLPIATSNPSSDNSAIHSPIDHNFPTPVLSTLPISIPSMVTPSTVSIPFFSTGSQSTSGSGSFKRWGRSSRGTYSGRGRASKSRRGKITSTTSCQTSPIPSYFWPDYQPSSVSYRDLSTNDALNLALMPRVFDHFPTSLPLDPLHYDFFTVLRAASPVVTFHCPSPLTQKSFSSVYSISFPHGHDSKPLLVAGIKQ